jgi:hypothetical protein
MTPRPLAVFGAGVVAVAAVIAIAPQSTRAQNTCQQGFVWREAFQGDDVCVTPETRAQAAQDNSQASARRQPGAYGPDTCLPGYVWREARPNDLVCVTPETRAQVASDNAQASARRAAPAPPPGPPAAPAPAPAPAAGQDQEPSSFESLNHPQHYIRHRSSLGYVDKIEAADSLGRKDATFRVVPGLAGKCSSFESVNYPGHYLRHQNFRLKLSPRADDPTFRADATFCFKPGLFSSGGRSFESFNFPGHYIRHSNFELWIARSDGSTRFRQDATFFLAPALTTHPPSVRIDPGD